MILKRFLVYFVLLFIATSCYRYDAPKKPKHLISKDKMVDVLLDIRLLSSANGVNKQTLEKKNLQPESYIYTKHKIDSLQFAESNNYYAYYVKDYEEIYTKVKDSLEVLKAHYSELLKEEAEIKKQKDSIRVISNKKKRDSIRATLKKDSLLKPVLKKIKEEKGLIKPISSEINDQQ